MKSTVPGFYIIQDIDFVKKQKGESSFPQLQKMLPEFDLSNISSMKKYSTEQEILLIRSACKLIYGDDSSASWEKWGYHDFETTRDSSLGKVFLTLFKNPKEVIINGGRMFAFFNPAIKFSHKQLSETSASVYINNDPYPKEYFYGLFKGFLEHLVVKSTIKVEEIDPHTHIYTIAWK